MKKSTKTHQAANRSNTRNQALLWAPWRAPYIRHINQPKGCVFCAMLRKSNDFKSLIVKRTASSFAVLNLYPYNNGHLLILPKRHIADFSRLTGRETLDLIQLQNSMLKRLKRELKPDGFNLGTNLGRSAGAGVPGHLHIHIVPRWTGDTNFMPVTGKTKVISQSLAALRDLLQ